MGQANVDAEIGVTIADTPNGQQHLIKDADTTAWTLRSIACKVYRYALEQWVRKRRYLSKMSVACIAGQQLMLTPCYRVSQHNRFTETLVQIVFIML